MTQNNNLPTRDELEQLETRTYNRHQFIKGMLQFATLFLGGAVISWLLIKLESGDGVVYCVPVLLLGLALLTFVMLGTGLLLDRKE